jgi:hypothetical protein
MATSDSEDNILVIISLILLVSSLGIFGWQIYHFLRFDAWTSVSVIDGLIWCGVNWASNPKDWMGLYRVFDWTPLALAIPVVGISTVYLVLRSDN